MPNKILTDSGASRLSTNVKNYTNARIAELTQSQYDALPIATKMNGTVYFINDTVKMIKNGVEYSIGGQVIVQLPIASSTTLGGIKVGTGLTIAQDGTLSVASPQWSTASDAEISDILDSYYNDEITWEDIGWQVGDTRIIHLDAMQCPNPNSNLSIPAQDIAVVIADHDYTDLATSINGHTKSCITVQTRECIGSLDELDGTDGSIYVNGDSSYDTTFNKWLNLYMRTYLNNIVFGAMSNTFKSMIKSSKHYRHTNYNGIESEQVTDTLFLPSYPEIFGTASYSYYDPTSPTEGTQFAYYKMSGNKQKKYANNNGSPGSTAVPWWNGSPMSFYDTFYYYRWGKVDTYGTAGGFSGDNAVGLAPAWAM